MQTFHEEQRFRQPWLWALLLVVAFGVGFPALHELWVRYVAQPPGSQDSAPDSVLIAATLVTCIIALGIPLLFLVLRLEVDVGDGLVRIGFVPFHTRTINCADIMSCNARTYRPLLECGGWGIRRIRGGWAYTVAGNEGVELTLRDGRRVLIGSARARDLTKAIDACRMS
ncbi:MAG: hypothetical protein GF331_09365 [Chitinivibrionales bacterium]|nr:hypothetical protein [Chitinivibrionales bacterium]